VFGDATSNDAHSVTRRRGRGISVPLATRQADRGRVLRGPTVPHRIARAPTGGVMALMADGEATINAKRRCRPVTSPHPAYALCSGCGINRA